MNVFPLCRHIVIYYLVACATVAFCSKGYGPPFNRWVPMATKGSISPSTTQTHHHSIRPPQARLPRRILKPKESQTIVEPRAFQVDHLPSTPQLNAIMDRAMGKVKFMVKELEDEKGKFHRIFPILLSETRHFIGSNICKV